MAVDQVVQVLILQELLEQITLVVAVVVELESTQQVLMPMVGLVDLV